MPQNSLSRRAFVALAFITCCVGPTFADEVTVVAGTQSDPELAALTLLDRLDARLAEHWRALDASLVDGEESAQALSQADVAELVRHLGQVDTQLRHLAVESALWSERTRATDQQLRELSFVLAGGARQPRHTVEQLPIDQGGAITGRVTAAGGAPLPGASLEVYEVPLGGFIGSASVDSDGRYVVQLPAGRYFVGAFAEGHQSELWDDVPCVGCQISNFGHFIVVVDGEVTTDIDFVLERSGRIAGRVTDAAGAPIPGALIQLWHHEHGYSGTARTDDQGLFESQGIVAGSYTVVAVADEFRRELYDDIPCTGGLYRGCQPEDGTLAVVALGTTTAGIDFALDRLGSIAGKVFDAATNGPFEGVLVLLAGADGRQQASAMTNASGAYSIGGLPDDDYFVWVSTSGDYVDEVYDNIVCRHSASGTCDPTIGTPVTVRLAATTDNIDFGLDLGGEITGRVLAAADAAPLDGIVVLASDAAGEWIRSGQADETGRYQISGLPTGTYYAVARDDFHFGQYASQVYDDRTCPERICDPLDGDPIDVTVRRRTANIDFDLLAKGKIEGRVTDAETGLPIQGANVTAVGTGFRSQPTATDIDGNYQIAGLPTNTYTVSAYADGWFETLHPATTCHRDGCDSRLGQPVSAAIGSTTEGIDIVMRPAGILSGTVAPTVPEDRLFDVNLYNATGELVDGFRTDSSGSYRFTRLEAGTYFVEAENGVYRSEMYNDRPCRFGCNPLNGDPVRVELGAETAGIDFVMDRLPTISGTVADADSGLGFEGERFISFHTADGQVVATAFAGFGSTDFQTEPIPPGTYFATLSAGGDPFWVYGAGRCEDVCNPTTGTPIRAELNSEVTGIDFAIRRRQGIVGRVTAGASGIGVAGIDISVWNADTLALVTSTRTGPIGGYSVGVLPGNYFVTTSNDQGGADEIWNDVPCPGGPTSSDCDLDAAERVEVGNGLITDIDFALDGLEVACLASDTTLCLNQGRFQLQALWRDTDGATIEFGRVQELTADTGYFWFFDPDNVEVVVKVLDACGTPSERFWVFAAGLTDVEVSLVVTDLASGKNRTYDNALGELFQPVQDTDAFATCGLGSGVRSPGSSSAERASGFHDEARGGAATMDCPADAGTLCLGGQRFHVEATWRSGDGGGVATAEPLTGDTGYFWFFGPDNVEVVVKVLDACGTPSDRFWVFAAGLTDVELELNVIDTETGLERRYTNVLGAPFQPIFDTDAFATCSP